MNTPQETGRILFVDDEEKVCEMVQIVLEKDGHEVDTAQDGAAGLDLFERHRYDMVIHDLRMPRMDGLTLLRHLRDKAPEVPVVVLTAYSTWDAAVEAMRLGAYNYLRKPFDNEDLRAQVQRALQQRRLADQIGDKEQQALMTNFKIIGSMPALQEILAVVRRVAATDSTVVIQGESGTGKELIARLIHLGSRRRQNAFIPVNCGAFTETLLESEIFGHVKGAFTGAVADKKGLLALADTGTFFLDELGEMSLQTQVKLLRVLETQEFVPVGDTKPRRVDVRFVAATNRDLPAMVANRTFREDLFYRLNVIPIHLPPLRERRDDIPLLAGHFLAVYNEAFGRAIDRIDDEAMHKLVHHEWPGNIRELQNTVQRAVTLATGEVITARDILTSRPGAEAPAAESAPSPSGNVLPEEGFDLDAALARIEGDYIRQALDRTGGNLTKAADLLGISFRSIRYKVKKLGLDR